MDFSIDEEFSGTRIEFEKALVRIEADAVKRRLKLLKFYSTLLPEKLAKWIDKEFLWPRLQEVMDEIQQHRTVTIRFISADGERPEGVL